MNNFKFGHKSLKELSTVAPELQEITQLALKHSEIDFSVLEGYRTRERQFQLWQQGASKLNGIKKGEVNGTAGQFITGTGVSKHQMGHAVDLAPYVSGSIRWDWPLFYKLAFSMYLAADKLNIMIEWGGSWKTFKDGPHFQLRPL